MTGTGLVVVPTYNEAENIADLAERILAQPVDLDLLVVDDASPDGTGDVVDDLTRKTGGRVRALHRREKLGLGTAYVAGFRDGLAKGYSFLAQMDADFSHDPDELPRLIGALAHADLVIGSRYVRGGGIRNWGPLRRLVSRGGSLYARLLLSLPVADATGGFRAWRRDALVGLGLDKVRSNGYSFQVEMAFRAHRKGARIVELPIVFTDRRVGQSKMSSAIFLEAFLKVPLLRTGVFS
ncbi:MAG: polyprenol monophosphomannose synthase [Planctomycetota bacterium]